MRRSDHYSALVPTLPLPPGCFFILFVYLSGRPITQHTESKAASVTPTTVLRTNTAFKQERDPFTELRLEFWHWIMMHPFFGESFPLDTPIFWAKDCPLMHPFWRYFRKEKEKFHTWCTPFDCTLARKADPKWSPPPPQQQQQEQHFPCLELSAIAAAKKWAPAQKDKGGFFFRFLLGVRICGEGPSKLVGNDIHQICRIVMNQSFHVQHTTNYHKVKRKKREKRKYIPVSVVILAFLNPDFLLPHEFRWRGPFIKKG